jgi:hypothetical protein
MRVDDPRDTEGLQEARNLIVRHRDAAQLETII